MTRPRLGYSNLHWTNLDKARMTKKEKEEPLSLEEEIPEEIVEPEEVPEPELKEEVVEKQETVMLPAPRSIREMLSEKGRQ